MFSWNEQNTVVIIGAGPAGLFAARKLLQEGYRPVILEREPRVGGKCHTMSDPLRPDIKTELGAALLAPNYGVVLDAVIEKGIVFEEPLRTVRESVTLFRFMDALTWTGKLCFLAVLTTQLAKFTLAVSRYHEARNHLLPLPENFEMPFTAFSQWYGIPLVTLLLKPLVTGFGYGAMEDIPAYCVMEYMGIGTIPAMALELLLGINALTGIRGGFQHLMERVAEDFEVITSASVYQVDRSETGVTVHYTQGTETKTLAGGALVLAIAPKQWPILGMHLTATEAQCVEQLTFYRYPVAVCKMHGLAPVQQFFPDALERDGTGHLALITTRDRRETPEGGRFATAYVNLPAGENDFSLDRKQPGRQMLKAELGARAGMGALKILHTRIWEDYMPTLPWAMRIALEAEQMRPDVRTLYVGAYPAGGFEDVRCVADQATRAVQRHMARIRYEPEGRIPYVARELERGRRFFWTIPRVQPVSDMPATDVPVPDAPVLR